MSMNLHCNKLTLIQTPTHITYMCMTTDDGKTNATLTGKKAVAALERYKHWLKSQTNGSWKSQRELDYQIQWVNAAVESIDQAIKNPKTLEVSIL